VSCVAIDSVEWFTSTSWRRDQIFEPYKVFTSLRSSVYGGTAVAVAAIVGCFMSA
jgi:hypothetical protein